MTERMLILVQHLRPNDRFDPGPWFVGPCFDHERERLENGTDIYRVFARPRCTSVSDLGDGCDLPAEHVELHHARITRMWKD